MKTVTTLIIATLALFTAAASAGPVYTKGGKAIGGYDTVAYFTVNKAVKGSSSYTHSWSGATWQFSSAKNRDLFKANPAKYAPQYGGYCAWAIAEKNDLVKIDPKRFDFYGGKLYLNYSSKTQKQWKTDRAGMIKRGNANYTKH